jgi:uncharacterized cupin superfamily protein
MPDFPVVQPAEIEDDGNWSYPGSTETFAHVAHYSAHFGLMRLGIAEDRLPPGRRTSWPHAEADEEEFVLVLEGTPEDIIAWCREGMAHFKARKHVVFTELPKTSTGRSRSSRSGIWRRGL